MGPGTVWVGTRYSPPRTHPVHTPGTPSPGTQQHGEQLPGTSWTLNSAVGLKSVDQLPLSTRFSGFQGITEVYNLATAGIPNDHSYIPGFD